MGSIVFCACKSSPLLSKPSQFSLWPSLKMLIFKSSTKLQNKSSKSYSSMPRSEIYSLRSPRSEIYSLPFSVSLTLLKRKFSHLVYCSNCVFFSVSSLSCFYKCKILSFNSSTLPVLVAEPFFISFPSDSTSTWVLREVSSISPIFFNDACPCLHVFLQVHPSPACWGSRWSP